jgi:hypothetical protein
MKLKLETLLTSDVSVSELKSRLLKWVAHAGFRFVPGHATSWTFARGRQWRSAWTQKLYDIPAQLVVQLLSKNPTRARCSIQFGGWLWILFTPPLDLAIVAEFRTLMACLCGAHDGRFRWVEKFERQAEHRDPFTFFNPMYLRSRHLWPTNLAEN